VLLRKKCKDTMISISLFFTGINLLGATQGLFLSLILAKLKRGNRQANRILAALVFVISIALASTLLLYPAVYTAVPYLLRISDPMRLLFAPLIFLYVVSLTGGQVNRRSLFHFTPFVLYVLYLIPTFYVLPLAERISFITEAQAGKWLSYNIYLVARALYFLLYLILSFRVLRQYSLRIQELFSSVERINFSWLRNVLIAMTIWWFPQFITTISPFFGHLDLPLINRIIGFLGALWMYLLGYMAFLKADPFVNDASSIAHISATEAAQLAAQHEQYEKHEYEILHSQRHEQPLTPLPQPSSEDTALLKHFQDFMETQKPYLDSELTLQKLSEQVGIPTYRLSQMMNTHLHQNFFDVVNRYRVEEWKRQIIDAPAQMTIQEVAFQVGFNSKSSFNAAFKKHTGQTPSEYRTEYRLASSVDNR
jgi:AraC-like DNA-binding protein